MAASTAIKRALNEMLSSIGLRIDSLTAERQEESRLKCVAERGGFDEQVFPLLPAVKSSRCGQVFEILKTKGDVFSAELKSGLTYDLKNGYFTTPDTEVLLSIVQLFKPKRVIEVGSGNSTFLFRIGARLAGIPLEITSVDPRPRRAVASVANRVIEARVEELDPDFFSTLQAGDILFVDSSHEIRTGNDVAYLFLRVLPLLHSGVVVHVHDIFLPYEYPREWVINNGWRWTEQYLLQAILYGSAQFEGIWPGYYLQKTRVDYRRFFPLLGDQAAKSFWMVKT